MKLGDKGCIIIQCGIVSPSFYVTISMNVLLINSTRQRHCLKIITMLLRREKTLSLEFLQLYSQTVINGLKQLIPLGRTKSKLKVTFNSVDFLLFSLMNFYRKMYKDYEFAKPKQLSITSKRYERNLPIKLFLLKNQTNLKQFKFMYEQIPILFEVVSIGQTVS